MDQLLKLAEQAGMSKDQANKALAGVFGLLKNKLPAEQYKMVSDKFPEADGLVAEQTKSGGSDGAGDGDEGGLGGFMGAAMGALGAAEGSTNTASLMAMLAKAGIGPETFGNFVSTAAPKIKELTGVDVASMLPGGSGASEGGGDGEATSNPMGQMMSMFGK
jgi:hypothetical protein